MSCEFCGEAIYMYAEVYRFQNDDGSTGVICETCIENSDEGE